MNAEKIQEGLLLSYDYY